MMNRGLFLVLVIAVVQACSQESATAPGQTVGTAAPRASGNRPPEVRKASLSPFSPTASTPLVLSYEASDPEGETVQVTVRWFVDNEMVKEGSAGALEPGTYRKQSVVFAEILPADSGGPGAVFRSGPVTIGNAPPVVKAVAISPGEAIPGTVLRAAPEGSDPDGDEVTFRFRWSVNGKAAGEQTISDTFNTSGLKKKDMVYAFVTAVDRDNAEGEQRSSDILVLGNRAPAITSTPPTSMQNEGYTYEVVARDPDNDKLTYRLEQAPAGMTISASGSIQWQPPKQVEGRQEIPIKIVVDDGDGGSMTQEFSLTLEMK